MDDLFIVRALVITRVTGQGLNISALCCCIAVKWTWYSTYSMLSELFIRTIYDLLNHSTFGRSQYCTGVI